MAIPNRIQTCVILAVAAASLITGLPLSVSAEPRQNIPATYSGIGIESSQQVFATMCALNAAGFVIDDATVEQLPARRALQGQLLTLQGPATTALRKFYQEHVLGDPGQTLSRFMAFALLSGPPPEFRLQVGRDLLPPDVLSIDGFQEVLAAFYREAGLDAQWRKIEPEYERAQAVYQSPIAQIVQRSNGYLREVLKSSTGRSFTVYVEPPMGNRTVFRNAGDQYGIVVGLGRVFPSDEILHGYLHFLIDPMVLRDRRLVDSKAGLLGIAARAPQLPSQYKEDFIALMDECLIKAVELRISRLSPLKLEDALKENDQLGYVLVRPLVQQLQKFEKAEPAMSYYFPDLVTAIDVQAEQKRMQSVRFAGTETQAALTAEGAPADPRVLSETDQLLEDGDREISRQNASAAAGKFEKVLAQDPHQPRALYGLAIASVLSGQGDRAKGLFEELVSARQASIEPVDPGFVAWSHVYLGRMHDLAGERGLAIGEYQAAFGVVGAPDVVRQAAQGGMNSAYSAPAQRTPR